MWALSQHNRPSNVLVPVTGKKITAKPKVLVFQVIVECAKKSASYEE